ncbi:MAG: hypothetical protein FJZ08_00600 [Candidatus Omnitrophica bacterium]|nr:hypothetical protein [Candidatus Omnitrophota bacterium]
MKSFLFVLMIAILLIFPGHAFCGIIEKVSGPQIAVEKLTGRGETYEMNFSGWVGSLKLDSQEKLILISEFSNIDGNISVVNGTYKILKIDEYDNSIDFDCADINDLTAGIEWHGKIWLTDAGEIKVEIVQKQSSRKWVNLSEYGKKFLKDNNIEKLDLGI